MGRVTLTTRPPPVLESLRPALFRPEVLGVSRSLSTATLGQNSDPRLQLPEGGEVAVES